MEFVVELVDGVLSLDGIVYFFKSCVDYGVLGTIINHTVFCPKHVPDSVILFMNNVRFSCCVLANSRKSLLFITALNTNTLRPCIQLYAKNNPILFGILGHILIIKNLLPEYLKLA